VQRAIEGETTTAQDTTTNDGSLVKGAVILPPKDALFLLESAKVRQGTAARQGVELAD
jgi:hypothetical protein